MLVNTRMDASQKKGDHGGIVTAVEDDTSAVYLGENQSNLPQAARESAQFHGRLSR